MLKKWIVLNAHADWLVKFRISCAIYFPSSSGKMVSRFPSVTSEEITQIIFLWCILSHCFRIYQKNYSPQCRWLALDIYLAKQRLAKYPPLATSTSVNSFKYSPPFKTTRVAIKIWRIIKTIVAICGEYARIFALGHYLFLVAHNFPPASLSENCSLLGTNNVRGQISEHIFVPNRGYCLFSTYDTSE